MAIYVAPGGQPSIFDELAFIHWRHSSETLRAIREAKRRQSGTLVPGARQDCYNVSLKDEIDLLASSAADTIIISSKWNQISSVDSYRELFHDAVDGKKLNTSFQFRALLSFFDIDFTFELTTPTLKTIEIDISRQAISDFVICDGQQRVASVTDIHAIWVEIEAQLSQAERFKSGFEVFEYIREQIATKISFRSRRVGIAHKNVAPTWVPSTHEWVHEFMLWTGVSPPALTSETDVGSVENTERPELMEKHRDFLFRQKDRTRCARARRARYSKQSSSASRASNRHFVSGRDLGRGAFCRSWPYRQSTPHQAA